MILVFGGSYQGKLDYTLERFKIDANYVYNCGEDTAMPVGKRIINGLDKWILALIKAGIDTDKTITDLINQNPNAVVICTDISCGVVPIDPQMRKWREAVGRALAALSRESDEVVRLFCGIATRLK